MIDISEWRYSESNLSFARELMEGHGTCPYMRRTMRKLSPCDTCIFLKDNTACSKTTVFHLAIQYVEKFNFIETIKECLK